MANKYNYLARNTIIFTISSFGTKLLAFLLVPFYTSVLSNAEYGTADLITTTSNLLIFVVTISIADAVMRFAIDGTESRYGVFRYGIKVVLSGCLLFGFVLSFFSIWNPVHWDKYLYLLLFLTIITNSINQLVSNYLRAIDHITSVAAMGMLVTVFTIGSNLVLLLGLKLGVVGYLISFIVGYVVSTVYGFLKVYKFDRKCFSQICDAKTKRMMIAYSFPLIFNGLAWWVNSSLDRYFIVIFYGTAVNGLYAVASKIPTIISVVNQIFSQAWNLSAIKEFDKEDKEGFFKNIYSLYNFILITSCSLLILLNIPISKILFAKDFFAAWQYSSVLVISAVFAALSGYLGSIFTAVKNSRIFATSTVIAAVINSVLNLVLIPPFGALGAAIATAISFVTIWIIRYICVAKYMKLQVRLVRDCVAYMLLTVQATIEHFDGHFYIMQGIILVIILVIYKREMIRIFNKVRITEKLRKNGK